MALTKKQIEAQKARPTIPVVLWANIAPSLRQIPNWVLWVYRHSPDRTKWTKVLENVSFKGRYHLENASSTNPNTWRSCQEVTQYYWMDFTFHPSANKRKGAGFCLSNLNPEQTITCIDLDDSRNRDTGEIAPWAQRIITLFDSYTEVSPSGTGVKIYAFGSKPGPRCKNVAHYPGVEIFDNARFLAVTGQVVQGTPADLQHRQEAISTLYAEMFPAQQEGEAGQGQRSHHAEAILPPLSPSSLSDQEIIDLASNARNGLKFRALWAGDYSAYGSRSEADFALAGILTFYCGPDHVRIESLMRASGLRRKKWDSHRAIGGTVLGRCIVFAIQGKSNYYGSNSSSWSSAGAVAKEIEGYFGPPGSEVEIWDGINLIDKWIVPSPVQPGSSTNATAGDGASLMGSCSRKPGQSIRDYVTEMLGSEELQEQNRRLLEAERIEEAKHKAKVQAAYDAIQASRRKYAELCPNCKTVSQVRRTGRGFRLLATGCERWDCSVCRCNNVEKWKITFNYTIGREIAPESPMFLFTCDHYSWEAVRKSLKRADGKFFRIHTTNQVISTIRPSSGLAQNVAEIPRSQALFILADAADEVPANWHHKKVFSSSKGWGVPKVDPTKTDQWTTIGEGPVGKEGVLAAIDVGRQYKLDPQTRSADNPLARIRKRVDFVIPESWSELMWRSFVRDVQLGEYIGPVEDLEFTDEDESGAGVESEERSESGGTTYTNVNGEYIFSS